jgi:pimeloyl-ACP methyl ester carboxylesterase
MLGRVAERLRTLETPDGRTLAYATWGDPDGFPILALHGTPGCRFNRWPNEELYAELGVYLVTHDRAGYGQSDRHRGRSVADEAADVAALADELGFDRFGVSGGSGGGPHVLACAALLPERVVRAICIVGVAPLGKPGLDKDEWVAGMDDENVKEFKWALAGEDVLMPELEKLQKEAEERVAVDPSSLLDDFELSESDRAELARPEAMQVIREATFEQAANGVGGWVDDDLVFVKPWEFDIGTISVPVLVRYGLTDVLVPPAHGEWLAANVPGCIVEVETTAGHLGEDPEGQIARDVLWLSEGIAPEGSRAPSTATP